MFDEILEHSGDFSQIKAVPISLHSDNDQTFRPHQALHDFLREAELLPAQCCLYWAITVAAVIAFEDLCDGKTRIRILISAP